MTEVAAAKFGIGIQREATPPERMMTEVARVVESMPEGTLGKVVRAFNHAVKRGDATVSAHDLQGVDPNVAQKIMDQAHSWAGEQALGRGLSAHLIDDFRDYVYDNGLVPTMLYAALQGDANAVESLVRRFRGSRVEFDDEE